MTIGRRLTLEFFCLFVFFLSPKKIHFQISLYRDIHESNKRRSMFIYRAELSLRLTHAPFVARIAHVNEKFVNNSHNL